MLLSTNENKTKVQIFIQLAQLYAFHLKDVFRAIELIDKAIILNKDPSRSIKLNEILGDIYFSNLRKFEKSKKIYKELIQVRPKLVNYTEYKFRYAESLFFLNELEESLIQFTELEESSGNFSNSKFKFRIALINYFLKKYELSIMGFKQIIDGNFAYSFKIKSAFYLAGLYDDLNELENSFKYYNLIKYDYPNTELIEKKINSIIKRKTEIRL